MPTHKVLVTLLAGLAVGGCVLADFHHDHYVMHDPWFTSDFDVHHAPEASSIVSHYAESPLLDSLKHGTDLVPKKLPFEDKSFKKPIGSYFTLREKDDPKIKELVMKSGSPYCQEIASKREHDDQNLKRLVCYRCKDPKNGSTYEQCSYSSKPHQGAGGQRPARSNSAEKTLDNLGSATQNHQRGSTESAPPSPFRFSEEFFNSGSESQELPAEYEKDASENCQRVVKGDMVCMVCKDAQKTGNYEQCSYVAKGPKGKNSNKSYAQKKAGSYGQPTNVDNRKTKPGSQKKISQKRDDHNHHHHHRPHLREHEHDDYFQRKHQSDDHDGAGDDDHAQEAHESHYAPEHSYHYPDSYDEEDEDPPRQASKSKPVASKGTCKTVRKNSEICEICTDPKTGGKSEQCSYSSQPKDKVYRYSKSKSFGNVPKDDEDAGGDEEKQAESSERQEQTAPSSAGESQEESKSVSADDDYKYEPTSLDYIKSESEKISKKVQNKKDMCKEVKRDGMICQVCKDPSTGGDFERCNYSYEPDDKVFAYTTSDSFGNPKKASSEESYASGEQENPSETYEAPVYSGGYDFSPYLGKVDNKEKEASESKRNPQVANKKLYSSTQKPIDSKVDLGYYDATQRRAEIEKIVKEIDSVDRSKCKKVDRRGMTCYRCTDEKGVTNEECVFVTDSEEAKPSNPVFQIVAAPLNDSSPTATQLSSVNNNSTSTTSTTPAPLTRVQKNNKSPDILKLLDSITPANGPGLIPARRRTRETEGLRRSRRQSRKRHGKRTQRDPDQNPKVSDQEHATAEAYDYVAETRPIYDKVLKMTLPAYMIEKSDQEQEFDEAYDPDD